MGMKYTTNGWTVSDKALESLSKIVKPGTRVLEFGSGVSTQFFLDSGCDVDSFDNDPDHAHPHAKIVGLVECGDYDFDRMFLEKNLDFGKFKPISQVVHTRQHNVFYDIDKGSLKNAYGIVSIDGPHGNGRSLAFLHCMGRLEPGTFIFMDDYDHYDFLERCRSIFNVEVVTQNNEPHDRFVLVKTA